MLNQNIINFLATILGGALAVIGGIVATYFTQILSNRAERRRFVREKCEEAYLLADQVKDWADHESLKWWCKYHEELGDMDIEFYGSGVQQKPLDCPVDRLIMIAMLHIPELRTQAQALKHAVNTYQSFSDDFPEQGWWAFSPIRDVDAALRDTDQKLEDTYLELKLLIEKTVLKNWGIRPSRNNRMKKATQKETISADIEW